MRIVFVCTTNVWGSAMADLMARSLLAEWDPDRQLIQVESVGVRAKVGEPIPPETQRVLADLGLEPREHRARWMGPELLARADLVLTIGSIQRDAALALNPRGLRSTFTLLEAARLLETVTVDKVRLSGPEPSTTEIIARMADARRFRPSQAGFDSMSDLVGEAPADIRRLAGEVYAAVRSVLRSLVFHPYSDSPRADESSGVVAVA